MMIANPLIPAFRYDPYAKKLTREWYDHTQMTSNREKAIEKAVESRQHQGFWGIVLGTLGRQGNVRQHKVGRLQLLALSRISPLINSQEILQTICDVTSDGVNVLPILLSELSPAKLAMFDPRLLAFVQTSCPRLSIDWGEAFHRPLLSPYEATLALRNSYDWMEVKKSWETAYPMDFYAKDSVWARSRAGGKIWAVSNLE